MGGLALLIGGQVILPRRDYAIINGPADSRNAAELPVISETDALCTSRDLDRDRPIVLFNKRVRTNAADWPLLGPADAPGLLVWFFDYTCQECHHMHRILRQALDHFEGRIAIAVIPIPLHPACNSTVKCVKEEHSYACQYARLGLAVWAASPGRFDQWDRFVAESPDPQPFGLSLLRAKELADLTAFDIRHPDPILDQRLASAIALFQSAGSPNLPSLILPHGLITGHINDSEQMIALLISHADIPTASSITPLSQQ
jgi:hypothetical protein